MKRPNLSEIRKRADEATEGPWERKIRPFNEVYGFIKKGAMRPTHCIGQMNRDHDAAFIAHSRQDIPDLLDYIEELERQNKEAKEAAQWMRDEAGRIEDEHVMDDYPRPTDTIDSWSNGFPFVREALRKKEKP